MNKILSLFSIASIMLVGCQTSTKTETDKSSEYVDASKAEIVQTELASKGKTLMENQCYVCHNPKAKKENRIAPPFVAIKNHYLKKYNSEEEFTAKIWTFLEKPTKEKAIMKGAIEKFGLMPYQVFKEKDINAIAHYLYNYNIEKPSGFKQHKGKGRKKGKQKKLGKSQPKTDAERGMHYAKSTKSVLGQNLMGAIQKKGVSHALSFCNEQAIPLTDSMANYHNVKIKRVSDQPRNPSNAANNIELEHIKTFKSLLANSEDIKPIVEKNNDQTNFYYPIVTNNMCLKCHGTPNKTIAKSDYNKILKLYPKDQAVGYQTNEVRGIWSISFKNNEQN
ncbi:MAG: c-type heme family protein [Psychroflexus salarius]